VAAGEHRGQELLHDLVLPHHAAGDLVGEGAARGRQLVEQGEVVAAGGDLALPA
jgi:hypothetical protein